MRGFLFSRVFGAGVFVLLGYVSSVSGQSAGAIGNQGNAEPHYKVLHNFQGNADSQGNFDPLLVQGLVVDSTGAIYGEAQHGGPLVCLTVGGVCTGDFFDLGTEFKLNRHGALTLFPNPSSAGGPASGSLGPMLLDADGKLIFATIGGGDIGTGGVFSLDPRIGDFTTFFSFSAAPIDGAFPGVNVIRDAAGNLYGTTLGGGQNPPFVCATGIVGSDNGCGTVYKLDARTHQETVLHTFGFDDGNQPVGLAIDSTGNVIGAASIGDDGSCKDNSNPINQVLGCGDIFQIDPSGNFSLVHEFHHHTICPPFILFCPPPTPGPPPELLGWNPQFVTVDETGNIFGVTGGGGNFGLGVIFKIDSAGQYTVLHHFAGPGDGFVTQQILLRDGKLYGINSEGGDILDCDFRNGCGTIFVLDTRTAEYKVLHTFSKNEEGVTPTALAFDHNGDLVGANLFGGVGVFNANICTGGGGCGNVFRFKLTDGGEDNE